MNKWIDLRPIWQPNFALMLISLSGCVGGSSVGAFTTTNFGINIQSTPTPVAELSYSRREGALEPTFEDGTLPAVAASIEREQAGLFTLNTKSRTVFAGGNAAVSVSGGSSDPSGIGAVACVTKVPSGVYVVEESAGGTPSTQGSPTTGKKGTPTVFATDEVIGFKATIPTGFAGDSLPSISLGYKRNEMALAPIFARSGGCSTDAQNIQLYESIFDVQQKLNQIKDKNDVTAIPLNAELKVLNQRLSAVQNGTSPTPKVAIFSPSYLAISDDGEQAASGGAVTGQSAAAQAASASGRFHARQVFATGKAAEVIASNGISGAIKRVAITATPAAWPAEMLIVDGVAGSGGTLQISARVQGGQTLGPASYTVVQADTAKIAAAKLAAAINANADMSAAGLSAFSPTDSNVVILLTKNPNPIAWAPTSADTTMTLEGPIP